MLLKDYMGYKDVPKNTVNAVDPIDKYLVGIEIEMESTKWHKTFASKYWERTADDSLRNGVELRLKKPRRGTLLRDAINELKELNYTCIFNNRCSNHYHIDMRNITCKEFIAFIKNWVFFEEYLFKYVVDHERKNNNFCVPYFYSSIKFDYLSRFLALSGTKLARDGWKVLHNNLQYFSKYDALNILPLTSIGSAEFRMFSGTDNPTRLFNHINMCLSILDAAINGWLPPSSTANSDIRDVFARYRNQVFHNLPNIRSQTITMEDVLSAYTNLNRATRDVNKSATYVPDEDIGLLQQILRNKIGGAMLSSEIGLAPPSLNPIPRRNRFEFIGV